MQKQKFTLPTNKWGTLKSKYQPESNNVTPDEFTVGSYNFWTNIDGTIEKRPTSVVYNPIDLSNPGRDQFEAIFTSGTHHLLFMDGSSLKYTTGDGVTHTATTGLTVSANMEYTMYQNRVYMDDGIDSPGVYDLTASYGGVSYSPPQYKAMGVQPPVAAPTFAADSGTGLTGSYHYIVTFLYYGFEESNGGPASVLHAVANKTINLTAIPIGGYGVTARKIYRDANDGNYLLVATISDNTTTVYADALSAGTFPIPTSNNLPPVFSYIALNLSRLWVAGVAGTPTTLYWSNPGLPDIFDPNNFVLCNPKDPIQAIFVYQGITVVLNRHSIGQILGNTDDTFYYQEVPGSVGCVDNRSIQVRTIDGVPTLMWLSDRGVYGFNGSSVVYLSDPIEDEVNLNLQQVSFTTGSNSQSSQADYAGGTASPSIDIASNPGTITVLDPEKILQDEADWEGGSSLSNLATADGTNQLKVPTRFMPTTLQGTLGGAAVLDGFNQITLTTVATQSLPNTGNTNDGFMGFGTGTLPPVGIGTQITFQHAGTLTSATVYIASDASGTTNNYRIRMYSDTLGQPGSLLFQATGTTPNTAPAHTVIPTTVSPNVAMSANTPYWITLEFTLNDQGVLPALLSNSFPSQVTAAKILLNGIWVTPAGAGGFGKIVFGNPSQFGQTVVAFPTAFAFTQTAVPSTGTWASAVYDSASVGSASGVVAKIFTSFVGSGSRTVTLFVDASNDSTMSTGVTTVSSVNPPFPFTVTTTNLRYWRLRVTLFTPDNTFAPVVSSPLELDFSTTGTWISQPIDCTTDVTSYDALSLVDNIPAGTSVTVTVATSADNITYSTFGPIGSATVHRWIKIKIILTTDSSNANTPSVTFLRLSWQQTSTFTSSVINVGQVPTGWGVFQNQSVTNGGTLTFYMRSAASSGAISAATFFVVSNGVFPPAGVAPLQFTQWKIVFTSAVTELPQVSSVTLNWFIGSTQSPIRVASLFFNKTYYLAAAEIGQPNNNVVIVYDFEGKWRLFRNVNINSLSLFFNQPFYCDAVLKKINQWLIPATGLGEVITMDVRTKAFNGNDEDHLKNVRSFRVTGLNTGTTVHAYYSVDRGTTWFEMLNVQGVAGYVTTNDGSKFNVYFVPDYDAGNPVSGVTVMFRIVSADAYPCNIMTMAPGLYVRAGNYLEEAL